MSTCEIKFAYVKYSTGEKEIVSVDRIKKFNATNINYQKKYKILWNENYYDGIIIFIAGKVMNYSFMLNLQYAFVSHSVFLHTLFCQ